MNSSVARQLSAILEAEDTGLLSEWMQAQLAATTLRRDLIDERRLQEESSALLKALRTAVQSGDFDRQNGPGWSELRELLGQISRSRAQAGFSPSDTATFVFSLKQPLFGRLRRVIADDAEALGEQLWAANVLLDSLGLLTIESYLEAREAIIRRQQEELTELSTPVVELWDDVLALPLVGTLDSARTQIVMESLLQKIVDTGASIAIIDITGVPMVDTLVAQHLLKTVAATRLMGADCIISGIRPQIAQTIVHLGVDLSEVTTKATLADAFQVALQRTGARVERSVRPSDHGEP